MNERVTYAEAAAYLKKNPLTINRAIKRGVLTPYPRTGLTRYLPAQQVRLFKDKPLALSALTAEEGAIWKEAARRAGANTDQSSVLPYLLKADEVGEEMGKRVGGNYVRGLYQSIREFDPMMEDDLRRPLAL